MAENNLSSTDWLIIHCYTIYHVKWKKWMHTWNEHFTTRRPDRRYSNINTEMLFQLHLFCTGSWRKQLRHTRGGYCEATLMCYWGAVMSKTKATLTASIGNQSSHWEWAETSSAQYSFDDLCQRFGAALSWKLKCPPPVYSFQACKTMLQTSHECWRGWFKRLN